MAGNLNYMKSNTSKLGEWIRSGLSDIGKNQVWLAEKIGVQPPHVSRIINGSSEATPDIMSAIADALGKPRIQAYRAAGFLDPQTEEDEWVEEMSHKLKQLSPGLRGVATTVINSLVEGEEMPARRTKSNPKHKSSTP